MDAEHRELDALGVGDDRERDGERDGECDREDEGYGEGLLPWETSESDGFPTSEPEPERRRGLDCLALYRREAARHPRPDAEEERRCFRVIREAEAAIGSGAEPPPALALAREEARERILLGHLDLVVGIARRYSGLYGSCGLPLEDLIQEGNLGLLAALDHFDPDRGRRFAVYAQGKVRSGICRALSTKARTIRIPLETLDLRRLVASVISDLRQRCGNETWCDGRRHAYRLEEVAERVGVDPDRIREVVRLVPEFRSLDAPETADGPPLVESVADPAAPDPRDAVAALEARLWLAETLARLPPRQLAVVRLRYGFDGGDDRSFTAIGEALRISGQGARALHERARRRLSEAARLSFSIP